MRIIHCARPHRALGLREVVDAVLAHVATDVDCLLAAARVNTLWADVATNWLWREAPGVALSHVSSCDSGGRRAYYDGKVRHITVTGSLHGCCRTWSATHADLRGWRLPHLTRMTLDRPTVETVLALDRVLLEQQAQVRLRALAWVDGSSEDERYGFGALDGAIAVLLQYAPRLALRSLAIETSTYAPHPPAILELLRALPSLACVELKGDAMSSAVDHSVLEYLAFNTRLLHLHVMTDVSVCLVRAPLPADDLEPATEAAGDGQFRMSQRAPPFSRLATLGCFVASSAALSLIASLPHLELLDIRLYAGPFSQVLNAIATRLTKLHSLSIVFESGSEGGGDEDDDAGGMVLHVNDLNQLSRLTSLRSLQLETSLSPQQCVGCFDDVALLRLIGGQLELRCLKLNLHHAQSLTSASLWHVGVICRKLETLELQGLFELLSLRHRRPGPEKLLPCLTSLKLREVYAE
jgi:hypothetical protein